MYADDHKDLEVQKNQHGADLKDKDGKATELKVSVCTVAKKTCNFNWPVPKDANPTTRRKKLLESIKTKTKGGGAIFLIKDSMARLIGKYTFSEGFLCSYFARLPLPGCNTHNMGCKRCDSCKSFHRLDKLKKASDVFDKDPESVNWKDVFAPIASNCAK